MKTLNLLKSLFTFKSSTFLILLDGNLDLKLLPLNPSEGFRTYIYTPRFFYLA